MGRRFGKKHAAFDTGYPGEQITLKFAGIAHCIWDTIWLALMHLHLTLLARLLQCYRGGFCCVRFVAVKSVGKRTWYLILEANVLARFDCQALTTYPLKVMQFGYHQLTLLAVSR